MRVRLATFNLFNVALPDVSFYPNRKMSLEVFEKKTEWVAMQLQNLHADIVAFQEVFHREALVKAIEKSAIYEDYTLSVAYEPTEIEQNTESLYPHTAILSRYPVTHFESISEFPENSRFSDNSEQRFQRPVSKAEIMLPNGRSITVFVAHLKSKRPLLEHEEEQNDFLKVAIGAARSLAIRAREAVALKSLLISEMENNTQPVIVMGDLNDSVHSVTTDILMGRPAAKRMPEEVRQKIFDTVLYSSALLQLKKSYRDVYYTHIHNSHFESLDHILVSDEFIHSNPNRIGEIEYMKTYHDHLLDTEFTNEEIPIWKSDHGQVLVSIKLLMTHNNLES